MTRRYHIHITKGKNRSANILLLCVGVGQGECPDHQADGQGVPGQGRHQLQHGQRSQVRRTGQNVQKKVPVGENTLQ